MKGTASSQRRHKCAEWSSGYLEISVQDVDKPRLGRAELEARLEGIQSRFPVCLTREPTFFGKAAHFEAPHFAIGCDTAMRLVDEKYYDGLGAWSNRLRPYAIAACIFGLQGAA